MPRASSGEMNRAAIHDEDRQTFSKVSKHVEEGLKESRVSKHVSRTLVGLRPPRTEEIKTTCQHVKECPGSKNKPQKIKTTWMHVNECPKMPKRAPSRPPSLPERSKSLPNSPQMVPKESQMELKSVGNESQIAIKSEIGHQTDF